MTVFVLGLFLLSGIFLLLYRAGKKSERLSKEEEINEAVRRAIVARDRLLHDRGYAERVRARFTR